jgi:hypothetical protein
VHSLVVVQLHRTASSQDQKGPKIRTGYSTSYQQPQFSQHTTPLLMVAGKQHKLKQEINQYVLVCSPPFSQRKKDLSSLIKNLSDSAHKWHLYFYFSFVISFSFFLFYLPIDMFIDLKNHTNLFKHLHINSSFYFDTNFSSPCFYISHILLFHLSIKYLILLTSLT